MEYYCYALRFSFYVMWLTFRGLLSVYAGKVTTKFSISLSVLYVIFPLNI